VLNLKNSRFTNGDIHRSDTSSGQTKRPNVNNISALTVMNDIALIQSYSELEKEKESQVLLTSVKCVSVESGGS